MCKQGDFNRSNEGGAQGEGEAQLQMLAGGHLPAPIREIKQML
ncbi:hypothetical protein KSF_086530 [Reticulibacter mediterranei]|uniref:Uncharacterized protein n=1 Tax=Reticulibacter mediterranei TaxID=2778369 RepID=A0A8J3N7L5_9CHLR|nr:hypothetical protein KSF_086530 [Reticulibacter mediterranei]